MRVIGVVIGVNKVKGTIDLSVKPSYLNVNESWWIANRNVDKHASRWYSEQGKVASELYDVCFLEKEALKALNDSNSSIDSSSYLSDGGHTDGFSTSASSVISNPAITSNNTTTNIDATKAKLVQLHMRQVHHPLFANCGYKEAEDRLTREGKGAGEVIIRPSSKGPNMLAITWAFQPNVYMHIDLEELNKKPGNLGLGR